MPVVHINEQNFEKEVRSSDLPVLIDFWAEWCVPCRMMGPVFEELSKEYRGKLKFAKINVDEEGVLANKFGIQGIPCLVLAKKGAESDRIVGFAQKAALKQKIDAMI